MATKPAVDIENDKPVREEEVDAGKDAVLAAYKNLLEATDHFKAAAKAAGLDLKQEAGDRFQKGRAKAEDLGRDAGDYVRDKPLAALGAAFFAGFFFAHLFGKR
ncbi:MAG: hypothetical protein WC997_05535 [Porticoccaceae bacterium]